MPMTVLFVFTIHLLNVEERAVDADEFGYHFAVTPDDPSGRTVAPSVLRLLSAGERKKPGQPHHEDDGIIGRRKRAVKQEFERWVSFSIDIEVYNRAWNVATFVLRELPPKALGREIRNSVKAWISVSFSGQLLCCQQGERRAA
jgi:hypothetical protein